MATSATLASGLAFALLLGQVAGGKQQPVHPVAAATQVRPDGGMRRAEVQTTPPAAAPAPEWTWRDIVLVSCSVALVVAAIVLRHFLLRRRLRQLE